MTLSKNPERTGGASSRLATGIGTHLPLLICNAIFQMDEPTTTFPPTLHKDSPSRSLSSGQDELSESDEDFEHIDISETLKALRIGAS